MLLLVDGLGATGSDRMSEETPLYTANDVWYVCSLIGNDANSGHERLHPLATLKGAVDQAADGDIIVLLAGHAETPVDPILFDAGLTIIGEGDASGALANCASFVLNYSGNLWTFDSRGVEVRNVRFRPSTFETTVARLASTSESRNTKLLGCYFEGGALEAEPWVTIGGPGWSIEGCTFVVTSTSTTPAAAISMSSAGVEDVTLRDCIFDAGTVGFIDGNGVTNTISDVARLRAEGITLLRGADISLRSGTTGYIHLSATGGGKVSW